ncbi:ABC transporter substrate-binding protein [Rhizobium sp. AG855]|uniref:ABC transporter substrate-binding protein n=1 Tax=Rhizobium sp. AG855 TaxID=2183898 RepID=UPI000E73725F|nr:ABC transporter substrate-binding protein [Rhizobium sp. AG855]RKE83300.1 NitT/TauT family transport system substrate-binding protein [Rhizobium sp. AG855]
MKPTSKTNRTEVDQAGYVPTRRTLCKGLVATLALPFLNKRAHATTLDHLILFGPPAGPSITLAYAVGKGLLREVANKVEFKTWRTPDEMRAGLSSGSMHAVVMPTTAAANLHTRGLGLKLANVMTNGLLYVVSRHDTITSFTDLEGQSVTVPFPNDTPELVFNAALAHHGMEGKVKLERAGTPIEAVQMLLAGRIDTALLPEPAVSAAIFKASTGNQALHRVIDMQQEWGLVSATSPVMPQAGLALTQSFLDDHPDQAKALLARLAQAAAAVNADPAAAANQAASALELPWPVLEASIPYSNLVAVAARDARASIETLLKTVAATHPEMIGGRMPDASFYL